MNHGRYLVGIHSGFYNYWLVIDLVSISLHIPRKNNIMRVSYNIPSVMLLKPPPLLGIPYSAVAMDLGPCCVCASPALARCSRCQLAAYCGPEPLELADRWLTNDGVNGG